MILEVRAATMAPICAVKGIRNIVKQMEEPTCTYHFGSKVKKLPRKKIPCGPKAQVNLGSGLTALTLGLSA